MNDLELIAQLDDSRDPDPAALEHGLARLIAGIADARVVVPLPAARRPGRVRARGALGLAAAAAAVALVIAVVHDGGPDEGRAASGQSSAAPETASPTSEQPNPDPSQLLPTGTVQSPAPGESAASAFMREVAAVAAVVPPIEPRPDQFLYVSDGAGYEAWLSIDGTRDGEVRNSTGVNRTPGCVDGIAQVGGNAPAPRPMPCVPQPVFLPDAPTEPQAMADYLIAAADEPTAEEPVSQPTPNQLGKRLLSLLEFAWLLPAAQAALFNALPLLPGLELTVDPVPGQPSTAVSWTFSGSVTSLLFDSTSLRYIGLVQTRPADPAASAPITSVMKQAIVDQVGDRP